MPNRVNLRDNITIFLNRIGQKTIVILLFIFSIYGFFVFGVESENIKLIIKILIVLLFLFFIYFRYRNMTLFQGITEQKELKSEKQEEKDIEVIKKLAEQFQVRKKNNSEADFQSYLNKILDIINSTFVASTAVIYLIDQEKNTLVPKVIVAKTEKKCQAKEIDADKEIMREIFEKKEIIINDELSEEEIRDIFESIGHAFKSFLGAPIFIEKEVIGVIAVYSNTKGAFGEEDKSLIKSFAEVVSRTVVNYNSIFEFETSSLLFSSFYEISKGLNSNLKFDEIIDMLINMVKKIFEFDQISLSIIEESGFYAIIKRVIGKVDEFKEGYRFPLEEGLNGWVIRKNRSILVSTLEKGDYFIPRYSKTEKSNFGLKSFLSAPIGYYNKCIGAITIESKKANLYSELHENVLVMLANNIGAALERSIIHKRLESEAKTDELTGLYNYREFRLRLYEEVNRTKRQKQKFCLFMMDIDKFKDFNDRYGHLVGDQILKAIGNSIKISLRNIDFVARYGGEEFAAIVITSDINDAKVSAERIRSSIEKTKYKFDSSEYHITISIGVAEYPTTSQSEEGLINKADQALYQAKAAGRNKIVIYEG